MHLMHELVHEFTRLFRRRTPLAQAEIERIVQELLVVRTEVEADRDGGLRTDTRSTLLRFVDRAGRMKSYPAPATYRESFPMEMGMPLTPRSPRPRIREP